MTDLSEADKARIAGRKKAIIGEQRLVCERLTALCEDVRAGKYDSGGPGMNNHDPPIPGALNVFALESALSDLTHDIL